MAGRSCIQQRKENTFQCSHYEIVRVVRTTTRGQYTPATTTRRLATPEDGFGVGKLAFGKASASNTSPEGFWAGVNSVFGYNKNINTTPLFDSHEKALAELQLAARSGDTVRHSLRLLRVIETIVPASETRDITTDSLTVVW